MTRIIAPAEEIEELPFVLEDLLSTNSNHRTDAEARLNDYWITQQPDMLLLGLSHFVAHNPNGQLRYQCSVLLRRLLIMYDPSSANPDACLWDMVQVPTRQDVKDLLLIALVNESDQTIRHNIADTISEIAKFDIIKEGQQWETLPKALFDCIQSPNAAHRESFFRVISTVPELISDQHIDAWKSVFLTGLTDAESHEVCFEAMNAAVSCIIQANEAGQNSLGALMPAVLESLAPIINAHDNQTLVDALMTLMDLANNCVRLYHPVLLSALSVMVSIAKDKSFEDRTRQVTLELLLTLCEAAPAVCQEVPNFVDEIIQVAMEMIANIEDNAEWYAANDMEKVNGDENSALGECAMDRLALALGGECVVPIAFRYIPQMLQSGEWQQHSAALSVICAISEGSATTIKPELGNIMQILLNSVKDMHPRVRYAACNAIGQMSLDFAPYLQQNFHEIVMAALLPVMEDNSQPRLQTRATAAMVNFCEDTDKAILGPYLDALFERLLVLLKTSSTYVQEQAINAITVVADGAKTNFMTHHSVIMPVLFDILCQATDKQYLPLRGCAVECASLIGLAIGKEAFASYTVVFIHILTNLQQTAADADDLIIYVLAAWLRICNMMGQDFLPYVPNTMPTLLQSARLKPDIIFADPEDVKRLSNDGWRFVEISGHIIGIQSSAVEEKYSALKLLVYYARYFGAVFSQYVGPVLKTALPLLKFYLHDGVRHAASALIPLLLRDAKEADVPSNELAAMWRTVFDKISKIMMAENDITSLAQIYATFHDCLDVLGDNCLKSNQIKIFVKATRKQLKKLYENRIDCDSVNQFGAYNAEDVVQLLEDETAEYEVFNEFARAIEAIFKTHRGNFLPFFDKLLPLIIQFLNHPKPAARQWAICIFDNVVEFTGPVSFSYRDYFLQAMVNGLTDPACEIRQAAAYSIGACGQFGGTQYADVCASALVPLFAMINAPNSRDEEAVLATEKAISAVAKICQFNNSKFNVDSVLATWLETLPIVYDSQEAVTVYTYLLNLLDSHHSSILGANNTNIPALVKIFARVLAVDILSEELTTRLAKSLQIILSGIDEITQNQLWNAIEPETRNFVQQKGYL